MTSRVPDRRCAPASVFERAADARLTRATLMRRTAAVAGGAAALAALEPLAALGAARDGDPRPIPGGFAPDFTPVPSDPFIHVLPPVMSFEMATITDFDGVVAAGEIQGTAHDNQGGSYWFDCDMRFMKGRYIDLSGQKQQGVFGFV
jgi:hypothetical protein